MNKSISISALGAVYYEDDPSHFEQALKSVLNQTRPPDEVVLVVDGAIPRLLENIIQHYEEDLIIVWLEKNVGLGAALNCGLDVCKGQYVARWDADDVQVSNRFDKQINFLASKEDITVLGGLISEFKEEVGDLFQIRQVPLNNHEVIKFAKKRSPVNHVTAMFHTDFIKKIGGYKRVIYMEDYDLWLRVLQFGGQIENLDEILSHVRIGNGMVKRRKGIEYITSEIKILKSKFRVYGYTPSILAWTLIRISLRLIPSRILGLIYENFLRKK